jgi:DNA-nicking Smr family endonuclease
VIDAGTTMAGVFSGKLKTKTGLEDLKRLLERAPKNVTPAKVVTATAQRPSSRSPGQGHVNLEETFAPLRRDFFLTKTDQALFAKAVEDVRPLPQSAPPVHAPKKPHPVPLQSLKDEAAALAQANEARFPSPMSWDLGVDLEEDQSYLRKGANPDLLRKLRRGMWVTQGELDLHHHTQDEAHAAMSEFLAVAAVREWRCVRIVHGKGLTSVRKEPVLRGRVRRWLQMRDDVMAFCEPKPNGGGSGAVLVLLERLL